MSQPEQIGSYPKNEKRMHLRAIEETRRKIAIVYALTPEHLVLEPCVEKSLNTAFDKSLIDADWIKRRDTWSDNPPGGGQAQHINAVAKDIMLQYCRAFNLKCNVKAQTETFAPSDDQQFFFDPQLTNIDPKIEKGINSKNLLAVHMHHLMNTCQVRLEEVTEGNSSAALKMHGYLIHDAIQQFKMHGFGDQSIAPSYLKNKTPQQNIKNIQNYGKVKATSLLANFKLANSQQNITQAARERWLDEKGVPSQENTPSENAILGR